MPHGETYANALRSQAGENLSGLDFFSLAVGDGENLPHCMALSDFDGVAWTGSPFSAYEDCPIVRHQITFAKVAFESGVPCFGSCWGLQVMSAALGGRVRRHVKGMEFGIGRRITLNEAGRDHAMYRGKPEVFDALCVHQDEVYVLPPGARLLAGNHHSAIQAAEITDGTRSFWGVQYHPEYDLWQMAALFRRGAGRLIEDGFARTTADVDQMVTDFRDVYLDPTRDDLIVRHDLSPEIVDTMLHRMELANWLRAMVVPHAAARARSI